MRYCRDCDFRRGIDRVLYRCAEPTVMFHSIGDRALTHPRPEKMTASAASTRGQAGLCGPDAKLFIIRRPFWRRWLGIV